MKLTPTCHPERKHVARGLCDSCYRTLRARTARAHVRGEAPPEPPPLTRGGLCAPRGPSGPLPPEPGGYHIPEGHELAGRSTLVDVRTGEGDKAWDKTRVAGSQTPPVAIPEHHQITGTATYRRGDGTVVGQWATTKPGEVEREELIKQAWKDAAQAYAGEAPRVAAPRRANRELITLYNLGDPHAGLHAWAPEAGENYDLKIWAADIRECLRQLIAGAPPSETCVLANLGDMFHAQDDSQLTPGHHNKLDVDTRSAKVRAAVYLTLVMLTEEALKRHKRAIWKQLPGNHDPVMASAIADYLAAWFRNNPRVQIDDANAAQQYLRFGKCLFGWTHGDACKMAELPALMATDVPEDWGASTERVWHTGHIHHIQRHEYPGCMVESHRTLAAKDTWHARRYRAGRSLSAITYHETFGEVDRKTVNVAKIRAALEAARAA